MVQRIKLNQLRAACILSGLHVFLFPAQTFSLMRGSEILSGAESEAAFQSELIRISAHSDWLFERHPND